MSLPISPETKIGALLEAYPALERELMACSPEFGRLRNPVLRKTVAKLASIENVAKVAGMGVQELVLRLRRAAGQQATGAVHVRGAREQGLPDWAGTFRVLHEIDAEAMLRTGEHPLGRVRRCAAELQPSEMVRLMSPFHPAPLIDVLRSDGLCV